MPDDGFSPSFGASRSLVAAGATAAAGVSGSGASLAVRAGDASDVASASIRPSAGWQPPDDNGWLVSDQGGPATMPSSQTEDEQPRTRRRGPYSVRYALTQTRPPQTARPSARRLAGRPVSQSVSVTPAHTATTRTRVRTLASMTRTIQAPSACISTVRESQGGLRPLARRS